MTNDIFIQLSESRRLKVFRKGSDLVLVYQRLIFNYWTSGFRWAVPVEFIKKVLNQPEIVAGLLE
jgi:hypothetical protein